MTKEFLIFQDELTQVIIVEYGEEDEVTNSAAYNIHLDGRYEAVTMLDWKQNVWPEIAWQELPKQVKAAIIELVLGIEKIDALNMSEEIPVLSGGSDHKFWMFAGMERGLQRTSSIHDDTD